MLNFFLLKAFNITKHFLTNSFFYKISIKHKRYLLHIFFLIPLLGITNQAQAENLVEIYRQALQNDPEWAAMESQFEADRQQSAQVKAGLKPKLFVSYSKTRTSRTAPDIGVSLNDELQQGIENCFDPFGAITPTCDQELLTILSTPDQSLFQLVEDDAEKQNTTVDNFSIQLTQPLMNLERLYAYRASNMNLKRTESEFDLAQQQFFLKIATTYFEALKAQKELDFAKLENKAINSQLSQTRERYELGLIRITDVHEAQSALDLSKNIVLLADSAYKSALEQLNTLTNGTITSIEPLVEDLPVATPKPDDAQTWVDIAYKNNKQISSAQASVKAAEFNVIQKRSGHAPTVDLFASIDNIKTDAGEDSPFGSSSNFTSDSDSETIGVRVMLPIYSGGLTVSQVRESKHQLDASRSNLEKTYRKTQASVKNNFRNVVNDVKRVEVMKTSLLSTEKALQSTREGYSGGNRNLFEVLQAQRNLFSAKRDLHNAQTDYIINSLKLKFAAGILDTEDILVINDWLVN